MCGEMNWASIARSNRRIFVGKEYWVDWQTTEGDESKSGKIGLQVASPSCERFRFTPFCTT
jgi:hypothetical protein